jgi:hypothetical protein
MLWNCPPHRQVRNIFGSIVYFYWISRDAAGYYQERVHEPIEACRDLQEDALLRNTFCEISGHLNDINDSELEAVTIPPDQWTDAFHKVGLITSEDEMQRYKRILRLNHADRLTYNAFKEIARSPSPLEEWVKSSIKFSRILTDALPKKKGQDYLRLISNMTREEINSVVEKTCAQVKSDLGRWATDLKRIFEDMDASQGCNSSAAHFSNKFQVAQMRGGTIHDFYSGLDERIGDWCTFRIWVYCSFLISVCRSMSSQH